MRANQGSDLEKLLIKRKQAIEEALKKGKLMRAEPNNEKL